MSKTAFLISPHHHEHVNSTFELVKGLIARGEEVVYFLPDMYKEYVESIGATFRSIGQEELFQPGASEDMNATYGVEVLFSHARDTLVLSKRICQQMLEKVAAEKCDYIIHDSFTLWAKQIAAMLNIPAVCTVSTFAYCSKMLDTDTDMFMKYVLRISPESLSSGGRIRSFKDVIMMLSDALKKLYGIEDIMEVFLAKEKLNIIFTSRYFHIYADTLDESFKFVGPSISEVGENESFPMEKSAEKPMIYIYLRSGTVNDSEFYVNCCKAFQDTDKQVVLSLGNDSEMNQLKGLPQNFIVHSHTLRSQIMKEADLFITNEGFDIISEALSHSLPMVILPYAADQSILASRIESLKAGIFLNKVEGFAYELKMASEKILGDESFKTGSQKISLSFKEAGGCKKAVEEIINFKAQNGIE